MAGVTDPVFRYICQKHGANFTFTEMISAMGIYQNQQKTWAMLDTLPVDEAPFGVQLFGSDPFIISQAAKSVAGFDSLGGRVQWFDINMGCPTRKVVRRGEGAALLKNVDLAARIVSETVKKVDLPVTVKMRKGWATKTVSATLYGVASGTPNATTNAKVGTAEASVANYADDTAEEALVFAKAMQDAGAAAITVHGRYANQLYKGRSDRDVVKLFANEMNIPVIASGDVFNKSDIEDYIGRGAAGVMVARGAMGNPWIFGQTSETSEISEHSDKPGLAGITKTVMLHIDLLEQYYPQKLMTLRQHLGWYFKGFPHVSDLRRGLNAAKTAQDFRKLIL